MVEIETQKARRVPQFTFQGLEQRLFLSATQLVFAHVPKQAAAGSGIRPAIVVDLKDGNGQIVKTDNSSVTLSLASGAGALDGNLTVTAKKGVATFPGIFFDTAGPCTLGATDSTDGLSATSDGINVVAGPVASLVFTPLPASATAGAAISPAFSVTATDKFGNLAGGTPSIKVSVFSGPHGGMLLGKTMVKASGGVATFDSVVVKVAGNYTLKASLGKISATAGGLTVNPAAPAKLTFTRHVSNVVAGDPINGTFAVRAVDSFGNPCTNSSAQVTLGVQTGPNGAAVGGTNAVALQNGLATFSALGLTVAGKYTLIASLPGAASVISPPCNVAAGEVANLQVVQGPSQGTHNVKLDTPLIVQVLDQFNNLVKKKSQVTLSLANGQNDSLMGNLTATAVNGTATFNDLILSAVGFFVLNIADGSATAQSGGISIS